MTKIFLAISFIICITLMPIRSQAEGININDIVFLDERGEEHTLQQFRGKRILLHFWATWCAPCVTELPSLNRLAKEFESKGVKVIPVSLDTRHKSNEQIQTFLKQHGLTHLPLYRAKEKVNYAKIVGMSSLSLPFTVLFDQQLNLVNIMVGTRHWGDENMRTMVLSAPAQVFASTDEASQEEETKEEPSQSENAPSDEKNSTLSIPAIKNPSGTAFKKKPETAESE